LDVRPPRQDRSLVLLPRRSRPRLILDRVFRIPDDVSVPLPGRMVRRRQSKFTAFLVSSRGFPALFCFFENNCPFYRSLQPSRAASLMGRSISFVYSFEPTLIVLAATSFSTRFSSQRFLSPALLGHVISPRLLIFLSVSVV